MPVPGALPAAASGTIPCSGYATEASGACLSHLQPIVPIGSACSRDDKDESATLLPIIPAKYIQRMHTREHVQAGTCALTCSPSMQVPLLHVLLGLRMLSKLAVHAQGQNAQGMAHCCK